MPVLAQTARPQTAAIQNAAIQTAATPHRAAYRPAPRWPLTQAIDRAPNPGALHGDAVTAKATGQNGAALTSWQSGTVYGVPPASAYNFAPLPNSVQFAANAPWNPAPGRALNDRRSDVGGPRPEAAGVILESVWLANGNASLSAFQLSGSAISTSGFTGTGIGTIASPLGLAFDSSGNAWVSSSNGVSEFNREGAPLTPTGCSGGICTGGGIDNPAAIAVDGLGQVWAANANGTVSVLSNTGAPVSPSSGYPGPGTAPAGIAIDISGNVWIPSSTANTVTMILGAAAPVVPLATGTATGTGVRP